MKSQETLFLQLNYTGGSGNSSPTDCTPNQTYVPYFACNDGRGDWNDGTVNFYDPIPPGYGYVIWNVSAIAYGMFDCNGTEDSYYYAMFIDENLVDFTTPPTGSLCNCPNCVLPTSAQSQTSQNGWRNYQFGTNNSFQFQQFLGGTICLSYVELTITYGPTYYQVLSVSPVSGSNKGGTTVNVTGFGFDNTYDTTTKCSFGGQIQDAIQVTATTIVCVSPAASSTCESFPCNVSLEISQNNQALTYNNVNFTYIELCEECVHGSCSRNGSCICETGYTGVACASAVVVSNGDPSLLWVWVAVGVCVGSVVLIIAAGYIYAKSSVNRSARFIDEQSRLINSEKFKKYGSLHPIDISEISIQHRIGRGSCAEVYMGSWRGTTVAIKKAKVFADDDEEFFTELAQEAEIMSALRHPNVLQFLGTASSPPELVIVMEFMSRGSLYRIIHDKAIDLPWLRLKQMSLDIARGMNYLHCSDPIIIHRDLKSHNLLVDEHFKVKVCDFGLSTMVKRHLDKFTAMTPVGTPCWTAPEVLRNEPYTERADVYSFGVVMWELVTREDPYHGMPTFQIVIAVGQHNMRPIIPPSVSPALTTLITQCWSEDPSQRPPFTEIVQRFEKM